MNGIGEVPVTQDERIMGILAHVLQIVGWWVAPLVIFLVRRESKFISFHALQALFLQIIWIIFWLCFGVGWIMFMVVTSDISRGPSILPQLAVFLLRPLIFLFVIGELVTMLVTAIVYAIKAGQGKWAGYPVIGNWVMRILKLKVRTAAPVGM